MSIKAMSQVWEHSQHEASGLLIMLAIADFADEHGKAYPSVARLAAKCRMKERNSRYILRRLVESGELTIETNAGPHGCNLYRLNLGYFGLQRGAGAQPDAGLQYGAVPPAKYDRQLLQYSAAKPSIKHHEPSDSGDGFDSFWEQYPKKVAKQDAVKAWNRLKPDSQQLITLMTSLQKQKLSSTWQKDGGQFIPNPANWLNGKRWMDVVTQPNQSILSATSATARPKPGDTRFQHGAMEKFHETLGWVPA